MPLTPEENAFLALVETLATRSLPAQLRTFRVANTAVGREYTFPEAPGLRVLVELSPPNVAMGIFLEGELGDRVSATLREDAAILGQTFGTGLEIRGSAGAWWIGEAVPLGRADRRVAERVARRLAAYILYFKPMMDDLRGAG